MSGILLISNDNDYLHDLLRIEGVSLDKTFNLEPSANNYNLLIINNLKFDEPTIKKFDDFCNENKSIILINPDNLIEKRLNLKKSNRKDHFIVNYNSSKITVIAFDFVAEIYGLNEGNDAIPDKNGVFRASTTSIVEKKEKLKPKADLLRRALVGLIQDNLGYPLPRIWSLPNKKLAGAIITHDSDEVSDNEINKINNLNNKNNIKATTFMLLKTGSKKSWQNFKNLNQDIQLHQAYFYLPNTPPKLSKIVAKVITNPIILQFQKYSLHIQKYLLGKLSKTKIIGARNHGLFWHKKDDIPLWMHKIGIKFDSTLGAVYDYGYFHGTGLPYFLRLPNNYQRLDVLEFPLHIMDYIYKEYKSKVNDITHKFLDNALKFNSIITFDFHHKLLMKKEILDWYLGTINYAKKLDLLINDMSYYNDFWRKRLTSEIIDIKFEKNKLQYKLFVEQKIEGLTQVLPLKHRNKILKRITSDNKIISFQKLKIGNDFFAIFVFDELEKEIFAEYA